MRHDDRKVLGSSKDQILLALVGNFGQGTGDGKCTLVGRGIPGPYKTDRNTHCAKS